MFARLSIIQGKPELVDEGIRGYREQTVPSVKQMKGFKEAYLMVNRQTGKMIGITMWETEKALRDSAAAADRLRAQGAQTANAAQAPIVEIYEVAVAEVPTSVGMK